MWSKNKRTRSSVSPGKALPSSALSLAAAVGSPGTALVQSKGGTLRKSLSDKLGFPTLDDTMLAVVHREWAATFSPRCIYHAVLGACNPGARPCTRDHIQSAPSSADMDTWKARVRPLL